MKKTIQILGTGCQKCNKLADNAAQAAAGLEGDFAIVKITDINDFVKFGVMMTPALAVNSEVKSEGKLLTIEEIKKILSA